MKIPYVFDIKRTSTADGPGVMFTALVVQVVLVQKVLPSLWFAQRNVVA